MIFDVILGFICSLPNFLLNSITSVGELVIPDGTFNWWQNIFSTLSYVFPLYALIPILIISFGIKFFQIMWAFANRVKSWVPFMRCLIQNWWQRTAGVAPICIC